MFIDNKYKNWYLKLTSKSNRVLDCYTENHHIIPVSMGGGNAIENLVVFTAREHFIAHLLLTKITTGSDRRSMIYALWNMMNRDNGVRTNSHTYSVLRNKHIEFLKVELRGSGNPMYGKTHSANTKKLLSDKLKGRVVSGETRIRMSKAQSGCNNAMYGKEVSLENRSMASKRMSENNPMKNVDTANKIREAKEGTFNCFDTLNEEFVRVSLIHYRLNKDRYKGNRSKEAITYKKEKEIECQVA